jgi:hypothetical protein
MTAIRKVPITAVAAAVLAFVSVALSADAFAGRANGNPPPPPSPPPFHSPAARFAAAPQRPPTGGSGGYSNAYLGHHPLCAVCRPYIP